jgi:hypothetical protein
MFRQDLFDTFRARAFDTAAPYLWSDVELQEYLDDAQNEAAERALLLRDSSTAEICEVAITAGESTYLLDERILQIERAKLDSQTRPLVLTSVDELDRTSPGWGSRTGSTTTIAIDAEGAGWVARLVGVPSVDDTLRLQVFRLPMQSIALPGDEPEIAKRLHVRLVDWMMFRAYSKKDAETKDEVKAAEYEAIFTSAFGPRVDANVRRKQRDRSPKVVQFQEF